MFLWQLPQHILAWFVIVFSGAKYSETFCGVKVYKTPFRFGISLGDYIVVYTIHQKKVILHEYGHSLQSKYFGPFYLLIIGLPSFIMNILTRMNILKRENYYHRWPENWADRLGGVQR